MSRKTLAAALPAYFLAIPGAGIIAAVHGLPLPFKPSNYPYVVYWLTQPTFTQWTFGVGGTIAEDYEVQADFYLGPVDALPYRMADTALTLTDQIRAEFSPLFALGGTVWDSSIIAMTDNLQTYIDAGEYPKLSMRMAIREVRTINAVAV